ncbi:MAG: sigma-70 family RNA polymerase sigma factor, partial [Planctomycetaceae bacterium]|nr:sigma-70 family RNA polymerase sigma factor [Planctomycetaceae bacterium]
AHRPMVAGICWRILGHQADAEDAVQEAFLQAVQLAQKQSIQNWGGLLRRLATTCALAKLRQRRCGESSSLAGLISQENPPGEILERKELLEQLRDAIAKLPTREAEVFCLRYLEDLELEEITQTLNVPYAAVTSAIYRAKKRLALEFTEVPF